MTYSKKITVYAGIILFILMLPLIAMQFSNEVDWKVSDFVMAAFLLTSAAVGIEITNKLIKNKTLKPILVAIVILIIALVWLELAVGIFNSPIAGS